MASKPGSPSWQTLLEQAARLLDELRVSDWALGGGTVLAGAAKEIAVLPAGAGYLENGPNLVREFLSSLASCT
jgi:hypothetical protein